jgi:aspartyl-tRNA(Asn)/glutamyl-tRNA(Gln) amidotransferase subunit A
MDHAGVFGRSIKDVAVGLDAVAGYDSRDPASVHQGEPSYDRQLEADVRGVRIGVLRPFLENAV